MICKYVIGTIILQIPAPLTERLPSLERSALDPVYPVPTVFVLHLLQAPPKNAAPNSQFYLNITPHGLHA